jgi:hypothetical protein
MCQKLLYKLNYVAIFLFGLTSTICIHIAQIAIGYAKGDDVISGIINSLPYNVIALVVFLIALIYIIWYSREQARNDKRNKQLETEMLVQKIKEALTESIEATNSQSKAK